MLLFRRHFMRRASSLVCRSIVGQPISLPESCFQRRQQSLIWWVGWLALTINAAKSDCKRTCSARGCGWQLSRRPFLTANATSQCSRGTSKGISIADYQIRARCGPPNPQPMMQGKRPFRTLAIYARVMCSGLTDRFRYCQASHK
jgi:hypothetical protein